MAAVLRHDQQLAVGVVEEAPLHRAVGGVEMDRRAGLRMRVAVAGHRHQAVDEVGRRRPASAAGSSAAGSACVGTSPKSLTMRPAPIALERRVHRRRADAVEPRAPVVGARRGERGAAQLLGVEAVRAALRRVAADRQRAGQRLGRELVAEAGLVALHRERLLSCSRRRCAVPASPTRLPSCRAAWRL